MMFLLTVVSPTKGSSEKVIEGETAVRGILSVTILEVPVTPSLNCWCVYCNGY